MQINTKILGVLSDHGSVTEVSDSQYRQGESGGDKSRPVLVLFHKIMLFQEIMGRIGLLGHQKSPQAICSTQNSIIVNIPYVCPCISDETQPLTVREFLIMEDMLKAVLKYTNVKIQKQPKKITNTWIL